MRIAVAVIEILPPIVLQLRDLAVGCLGWVFHARVVRNVLDRLLIRVLLVSGFTGVSAFGWGVRVARLIGGSTLKRNLGWYNTSREESGVGTDHAIEVEPEVEAVV